MKKITPLLLPKSRQKVSVLVLKPPPQGRKHGTKVDGAGFPCIQKRRWKKAETSILDLNEQERPPEPPKIQRGRKKPQTSLLDVHDDKATLQRVPKT